MSFGVGFIAMLWSLFRFFAISFIALKSVWSCVRYLMYFRRKKLGSHQYLVLTLNEHAQKWKLFHTLCKNWKLNFLHKSVCYGLLHNKWIIKDTFTLHSVHKHHAVCAWLYYIADLHGNSSAVIDAFPTHFSGALDGFNSQVNWKNLDVSEPTAWKYLYLPADRLYKI
jgi:hypothetical protein